VTRDERPLSVLRVVPEAPPVRSWPRRASSRVGSAAIPVVVALLVLGPLAEPALAAADAERMKMLNTVFIALASGILLLVASHLLRFPSIVLLLAGGVLLGPQVLGLVHADSLGDGLGVIVSLSIGIILFEGGLTLDMSGYWSTSSMIKRLLSIGVILTWLLSAGAILAFTDMSPPLALLAASLVIVTGPTVIAPLLKRISVSSRLHSILHWEGVLIDPIGVFVALFCYEWIVEAEGWTAAGNFLVRFIGGIVIGVAGGFGIFLALRRQLIPSDYRNIATLAIAVLIFGLAEQVLPEAGLLAVTVAGFLMGILNPGKLKEVRRFKADITDILIGILFILLASRLEFSQFLDFGLGGLAAVLVVMFVVRPIVVATCSWGLDLSLRERAFLSWVAPRGIVAASLASLLTLRLEGRDGFENARFIETFTYSVIIGTILLQGLSAGLVARLLGVQRPEPTGWIIVGAHAFSRRLAEFLRDTAGVQVQLLDTNARAVGEARRHGFAAQRADALDPKLPGRDDLYGTGHVLALTDNDELNVLVCQRWAEVVGEHNVYRWSLGGRSATDDGGAAGRVVWPRLPKPTLLGAEIVRGEVSFIEDDGSAVLPPHVTTELLSWTGQRIIVAAAGPTEGTPTPTPTPTTPPAVKRRLYLKRDLDYLLQCMRPELVLRFGHPDGVESLLREVVEAVKRSEPAIDADEAYVALIRRQNQFPAALGQGVAVPHAYIDSAPGRICAVVRVPGGLEFEAPDDEPVRLVFVLLSPPGDPDGHLATIAEIARLVVDPEKRRRFLETDDPGEIMDLVRSG